MEIYENGGFSGWLFFFLLISFSVFNKYISRNWKSCDFSPLLAAVFFSQNVYSHMQIFIAANILW